LELLISHGANINLKDWRGIAPLHEVVMGTAAGKLKTMKVLIDNGANVNIRAGDQWTPLHMAAFDNYPELVELLLKRGAWVNTRNAFGQTPLFLAAQKGNKAVIRLLVKYGASETICDHRGEKPRESETLTEAVLDRETCSANEKVTPVSEPNPLQILLCLW